MPHLSRGAEEYHGTVTLQTSVAELLKSVAFIFADHVRGFSSRTVVNAYNFDRIVRSLFSRACYGAR